MSENELIFRQKEICLKYGAEYLTTPFYSIAGIALDTFNKGFKPINGLRHPEAGAYNSGWYLWAGEYSSASDFFKPFHVKHLLEICPKALDFLGLAPGWRFLIGENDYKDIWFDSSLLDI